MLPSVAFFDFSSRFSKTFGLSKLSFLNGEGNNTENKGQRQAQRLQLFRQAEILWNWVGKNEVSDCPNAGSSSKEKSKIRSILKIMIY